MILVCSHVTLREVLGGSFSILIFFGVIYLCFRREMAFLAVLTVGFAAWLVGVGRASVVPKIVRGVRPSLFQKSEASRGGSDVGADSNGTQLS